MTANAEFLGRLCQQLDSIGSAGLAKIERLLTTAQCPLVSTYQGRESINLCANNHNLCANNHLTLSNHPQVISAAKETLSERGFGLSLVRFICGMEDIHKEVISQLSSILGTEVTILYSSAFDSSGGLFQPRLGPEDAIGSDGLNRA